MYITEVVADSVQFLEPKGGRGQAPMNNNNNFMQQPGTPSRGANQDFGNPFEQDDDPFAGDGKPIDISDDDLPF